MRGINVHARSPVCIVFAASSVPAAWRICAGERAGGSFQHEHAAQAPVGAMKQSRWSDPKSWPDGKVPGAGDAVTIAQDRSIILDVTPPALRSLTINGKLSFANHARHQPHDRVDLSARRHAGDRQRGQALYAQCPHHPDRQRAQRRHPHPGRPGHHAAERHPQPAWQPHQQLDQASPRRPRAGAGTIAVLNAAGWRKGDVIVLALDRL